MTTVQDAPEQTQPVASSPWAAHDASRGRPAAGGPGTAVLLAGATLGALGLLMLLIGGLFIAGAAFADSFDPADLQGLPSDFAAAALVMVGVVLVVGGFLHAAAGSAAFLGLPGGRFGGMALSILGLLVAVLLVADAQASQVTPELAVFGSPSADLVAAAGISALYLFCLVAFTARWERTSPKR